MKPAGYHNTPFSASDSLRKVSSAREPRVGLRGGRNRHYTLAEKFAARVTVGGPDECWPIEGSQLHSGHVQISSGSPRKPGFVRVRAHVYAWEQANGCKVPKGLVVMHTCDNPRCCNARHLRVGTQRDNILDSIHKGRHNCFGRQKLDASKVREIRTLAARGVLQRVIAAKFNIGRSAISGIVHGTSWSHVPLENGSLVLEPVPYVLLPVCGEVS